MPDFSYENEYDGIICGLDEAGRAPLAGPVVAGCVYIPAARRGDELWCHVDDSKKISKKRREELYMQIQKSAMWGIGEACPRTVEDINVIQASFLAMRRAYEDMLEGFDVIPSVALIDGNLRPDFACEAIPIIKGDQKSISIAAASILAKVYRDRIMNDLAQKHPYYGWERNAGYPTKQHIEAIQRHGITNHHRTSFAPVRDYIETQKKVVND